MQQDKIHFNVYVNVMFFPDLSDETIENELDQLEAREPVAVCDCANKAECCFDREYRYYRCCAGGGCCIH